MQAQQQQLSLQLNGPYDMEQAQNDKTYQNIMAKDYELT